MAELLLKQHKPRYVQITLTPPQLCQQNFLISQLLRGESISLIVHITRSAVQNHKDLTNKKATVTLWYRLVLIVFGTSMNTVILSPA